MTDYLKATGNVFLRYRHLLEYMVHRDITVKYRRSKLGLAWSILNPFLMMLIMTAVFSYMFKQQIEFFPVYLLAGQVTFNFFSEATSLAMDSVLSGAALLKKVYIPKYIFPLEKVVFSTINTMFSLVSLILVIIVMRVPLTPWILLFPLPLILLFFFNLGVGMALASMVIFFRDIKHLYGIVVLALTYFTPIFYPASLLPDVMQYLIRLNPMYWFVSMFRNLVLYGTGPTLMQLFATCLSAGVAMLVGLLIFKKTQDQFILYI